MSKGGFKLNNVPSGMGISGTSGRYVPTGGSSFNFNHNHHSNHGSWSTNHHHHGNWNSNGLGWKNNNQNVYSGGNNFKFSGSGGSGRLRRASSSSDEGEVVRRHSRTKDPQESSTNPLVILSIIFGCILSLIILGVIIATIVKFRRRQAAEREAAKLQSEIIEPSPAIFFATGGPSSTETSDEKIKASRFTAADSCNLT